VAESAPLRLASPECRSEIQHAVDLGKRLIPILKDPDFEAERLPDPVRKIQWLSVAKNLLARGFVHLESKNYPKE
jgi:hypothetical protein